MTKLSRKRILEYTAYGVLLLVGVYYFVKYRVAPDIDTSNIALIGVNEKPFLINELKGKPLILNFMATWCGPCLQEMPSLEVAKEALEPYGFEFLAVSDEDVYLLDSYKSRWNLKMDFYQLQKPSMKDLGIYSIPTTYVINREGKVVFKKTGAYNWATKENLQKFIRLTE